VRIVARRGIPLEALMKVTATSDWRETIAFETPMIVSAVVPGDPARCSVCGGASALRPRTDLWVVKHRHPNHHAGYVRFYCQAHLPAIERPAAPAETRRSAARTERAAVRRISHIDEKPRAMCPDCFVEVSATGLCGMCGTQVA
jgi:hypothetical protein